jgi:hypothetical protein
MLTHISKPTEIAKRTAIFTAVGQIGSMCAGLMMTAMHKTMEGRSGLKGWQWVFIIGEYFSPLSPRALHFANRCSKMASWVYQSVYLDSYVVPTLSQNLILTCTVDIPRPARKYQSQVSQRAGGAIRA